MFDQLFSLKALPYGDYGCTLAAVAFETVPLASFCETTCEVLRQVSVDGSNMQYLRVIVDH